MKHILFSLMLLIFTLGNIVIHAQYKRVNYPYGIQVFDNNDVDVSFTGNRPTYTNAYLCDAGPYWIGHHNFLGETTPLSYTFTFTNPVSHIRIDVGELWHVEAVTIYINNIPYVLNNNQLSLPPDRCYDTWKLAIITGGTLTAPPGPMPGNFEGNYAGRLQIKESNITSVTIEYTGIVDYNYGTTGARASFYFGQINASNNGPVCLGDNLQLLGDPTITEPGVFLWKGPNGYTANEQSPVINSLSYQDTGMYMLTYINGVDTFTDTTHVLLLPGPVLPAITADSPVCAGSTLKLSAQNTPGASYSWSGPNGFTANGQTVSIPDIQRSNAGTYTVTASLYGCNSRSAKEVAITQPVTHSFREIVCSNNGYDFNGLHLNEPGLYIDTFQGSNGCDSFSKLNLIVLPSPDVTATLDNDVHCLGDTIILYAVGNVVKYLWYNGQNDFIGSGSEMSFTLEHTNDRITLLGMSDNDCRDTFVLDILAKSCCQLSVPNAFSPNNDGINDVFVPVTNGNFQTYKMHVFNRWGQQIFLSDNSQKGWDGTYNGMPADIGVYQYLIVDQCLEGPRIEEKGDVLLIR